MRMVKHLKLGFVVVEDLTDLPENKEGFEFYFFLLSQCILREPGPLLDFLGEEEVPQPPPLDGAPGR